jgi:hypothetical protein
MRALLLINIAALTSFLFLFKHREPIGDRASIKNPQQNA